MAFDFVSCTSHCFTILHGINRFISPEKMLWKRKCCAMNGQRWELFDPVKLCHSRVLLLWCVFSSPTNIYSISTFIPNCITLIFGLKTLPQPDSIGTANDATFISDWKFYEITNETNSFHIWVNWFTKPQSTNVADISMPFRLLHTHFSKSFENWCYGMDNWNISRDLDFFNFTQIIQCFYYNLLSGNMYIDKRYLFLPQ